MFQRRFDSISFDLGKILSIWFDSDSNEKMKFHSIRFGVKNLGTSLPVVNTITESSQILMSNPCINYITRI